MSVLPGSEYPIPVGLTVRPRLDTLFGARASHRAIPFVCNAGTQVEHIEIAFAEGLPLPLLPDDVQVHTKWFKYRADYRLENRTLKITREFISTVTSQVCPAAVEAEIVSPMKVIDDDLARKLKFGTALAARDRPQDAARAVP
jgi:hypothetical protein